jgi:hypothetical protein
MTLADAAPDELAPPSTTARTLRRLRVALVAGCLLLGVLCPLAVSRSQAVIAAAGHHAAPAVLEVEAARGALVDAQRSAVDGIAAHTAALGGPGGRYENDIAAIDQSLSQLAGDNAAGADGTSDLQLVEGLVVSYNAQVEQAFAEYQQNLDPGQALPGLWYATQTLGQVVKKLGTLEGEQHEALDAERHSAWLAGPSSLLWLLPLLVLLALFWWTQRVVRERFRRRLSVRLAAAAAALLGMALLTGLTLGGAGEHFDTAVGGHFSRAVALAGQQSTNSAQHAAHDLFTLIPKSCSTVTGYCGTGLNDTAVDPSGDAAAGRQSRQQTQEQDEFRQSISAATGPGTTAMVLLTVLAVAAAVLTAFGLRPRIDEYRFGAR